MKKMKCEWFDWEGSVPTQCCNPVTRINVHYWSNWIISPRASCEHHISKGLDRDSRVVVMTLEEYEIFKIKEAL